MRTAERSNTRGKGDTKKTERRRDEVRNDETTEEIIRSFETEHF